MRRSIAIASVLFLLILTPSLARAGLMTIGGSSMLPTLHDGQKVQITAYPKGANPERGDIVAFKDDKALNLKRVVGLPGEKLIIKEGSVYLIAASDSQEKKLDEPYLSPGTITEPAGEYAIPDGQYFVLGDNRGAARDSRKIGYIRRANIAGKITKIY